MIDVKKMMSDAAVMACILDSMMAGESAVGRKSRLRVVPTGAERFFTQGSKLTYVSSTATLFVTQTLQTNK